MNIENLVGLGDGKIMLNGVEIYHYKENCSYKTYTVYVKKFRDLDDFFQHLPDGAETFQLGENLTGWVADHQVEGTPG